jgi:hypothetical protein
VPIPKLVASGADTISELEGGGMYNAFGWAKAQLDILCLDPRTVAAPPKAAGAGATGSGPKAKTLPGDVAPVTEKSRTNK